MAVGTGCYKPWRDVDVVLERPMVVFLDARTGRIALHNRTSEAFTFKLKAAGARRYRAAPCVGLLPSGGGAHIEIECLHAADGDAPTPPTRTQDRFELFVRELSNRECGALEAFGTGDFVSGCAQLNLPPREYSVLDIFRYVWSDCARAKPRKIILPAVFTAAAPPRKSPPRIMSHISTPQRSPRSPSPQAAVAQPRHPAQAPGQARVPADAGIVSPIVWYCAAAPGSQCPAGEQSPDRAVHREEVREASARTQSPPPPTPSPPTPSLPAGTVVAHARGESQGIDTSLLPAPPVPAVSPAAATRDVVAATDARDVVLVPVQPPSGTRSTVFPPDGIPSLQPAQLRPQAPVGAEQLAQPLPLPRCRSRSLSSTVSRGCAPHPSPEDAGRVAAASLSPAYAPSPAVGNGVASAHPTSPPVGSGPGAPHDALSPIPTARRAADGSDAILSLVSHSHGTLPVIVFDPLTGECTTIPRYPEDPALHAHRALQPPAQDSLSADTAEATAAVADMERQARASRDTRVRQDSGHEAYLSESVLSQSILSVSVPTAYGTGDRVAQRTYTGVSESEEIFIGVPRVATVPAVGGLVAHDDDDNTEWIGLGDRVVAHGLTADTSLNGMCGIVVGMQRGAANAPEAFQRMGLFQVQFEDVASGMSTQRALTSANLTVVGHHDRAVAPAARGAAVGFADVFAPHGVYPPPADTRSLTLSCETAPAAAGPAAAPAGDTRNASLSSRSEDTLRSSRLATPRSLPTEPAPQLPAGACHGEGAPDGSGIGSVWAGNDEAPRPAAPEALPQPSAPLPAVQRQCTTPWSAPPPAPAARAVATPSQHSVPPPAGASAAVVEAQRPHPTTTLPQYTAPEAWDPVFAPGAAPAPVPTLAPRLGTAGLFPSGTADTHPRRVAPAPLPAPTGGAGPYPSAPLSGPLTVAPWPPTAYHVPTSHLPYEAVAPPPQKAAPPMYARSSDATSESARTTSADDSLPTMYMPADSTPGVHEYYGQAERASDTASRLLRAVPTPATTTPDWSGASEPASGTLSLPSGALHRLGGVDVREGRPLTGERLQALEMLIRMGAPEATIEEVLHAA